MSTPSQKNQFQLKHVLWSITALLCVPLIVILFMTVGIFKALFSVAFIYLVFGLCTTKGSSGFLIYGWPVMFGEIFIYIVERYEELKIHIPDHVLIFSLFFVFILPIFMQELLKFNMTISAIYTMASRVIIIFLFLGVSLIENKFMITSLLVLAVCFTLISAILQYSARVFNRHVFWCIIPLAMNILLGIYGCTFVAIFRVTNSDTLKNDGAIEITSKIVAAFLLVISTIYTVPGLVGFFDADLENSYIAFIREYKEEETNFSKSYITYAFAASFAVSSIPVIINVIGLVNLAIISLILVTLLICAWTKSLSFLSLGIFFGSVLISYCYPNFIQTTEQDYIIKTVFHHALCFAMEYYWFGPSFCVFLYHLSNLILQSFAYDFDIIESLGFKLKLLIILYASASIVISWMWKLFKSQKTNDFVIFPELGALLFASCCSLVMRFSAAMISIKEFDNDDNGDEKRYMLNIHVFTNSIYFTALVLTKILVDKMIPWIKKNILS